MRPSIARTTALAASLALAAHALDGLTVPSSIAADTEFQATFQNGNSDNYRVYLAASLAGTNGPTCYLQNSTSLSSPLTLTIPASVGPPANYYSIAIADLADLSPSSNSPATYSYSNHFALTASNGNYTPYEQHLGGAPFWDANALPCSSYACARQCAQAGFPGDLSDQGAWEVMKGCILGCAGVEPAVGVTGPALASSGSGTGTGTTSSVSASGTGTETGAGGGGVGTATRTADEVLVTLLPGVVMTAVETTATISGSAVTEAVLGSVTLTLGGAEATVSGKAVSLASSGVEVGGSTTVAFSSAVQTFATTTSSGQAGSASETGAAPAATSSAGAARGREVAMVGIAGVAGLAVMLF
ncbi:hypothetical protein LTS16_015521 [Friedmanniomyces endolithicus]|nr:hypothetical protein LTS16_015521 [Friedmanniomyces endolithicus]